MINKDKIILGITVLILAILLLTVKNCDKPVVVPNYEKTVDSLNAVITEKEIILAEKDLEIDILEIELDSIKKSTPTFKQSIVTIKKYIKDTIHITDTTICLDSIQIKEVAKCFEKVEVYENLVSDLKDRDTVIRKIIDLKDTIILTQAKELKYLHEEAVPTAFKKGKKEGIKKGVKRTVIAGLIVITAVLTRKFFMQ